MSYSELHRVQNTAALITLRMPRTEHTTLILLLHWLPIPSKIAYKIDSLCHTALTTAYPKYLSELLNVYTPARPLCSKCDPNIPNIAAARIKSYGHQAFAYQWSINWNRVPGGIRTVEQKETFKKHLQTSADSTVQQAGWIKISTLSHYLFILLFIISSCVHFFLLFSIISMWLSRILDPMLLSTYIMYCACVVTFCCCPI